MQHRITTNNYCGVRIVPDIEPVTDWLWMFYRFLHSSFTLKSLEAETVKGSSGKVQLWTRATSTARHRLYDSLSHKYLNVSLHVKEIYSCTSVCSTETSCSAASFPSRLAWYLKDSERTLKVFIRCLGL